MTQTKIALVTGGSRGLGKDMAINIAKKGINVILTYNKNQKEANEVVSTIEKSGVKAAALALDVSDSKSFDVFFESLKNILSEKFSSTKFDFLVNNAGFGAYASLADTTVEQFDALMNVHLKGPYFLTQKSLVYMNDGGGIVNISSGLARFSYPGYSAYASMKGGIEVLSRYMAKELGTRKIRVNVVAPGAIETDFGGGTVRDNQQVNAMIASQTALGRAGLPDDVGSVVAFLCSDESKWVNGQRIEVSGGIHL